MPAELADEQLLRVLTICDQYAQQQKMLGEKLSSGIFQILQARKNVSISSDNIRQDFDSCLYLINNDEKGCLELWDGGDTNDALLMFTALPPPALRKAQKLFIESVKIALELVTTVTELELETH